jgi:thymidylate kinase
LERKGGSGPGDRIEREGVAFLARVREGYRSLALETPSARLVPAGGGRKEVQEALRREMAEAFPETFSRLEV